MNRPITNLLSVVWTAVVVLGSQTSLHAQPPTIVRIDSTHFAPGKTVSLTAHGAALKNVLHLWTPVCQLPYKAADKPNEKLAQFEGPVPDTVVPGVYETRVVTAQGISARQFLVIDDLPSLTLPNACEVNPPTTKLPTACCFNGQINPLKPKFFGLDLKKDQQVSIEVFARRLNSPLDPVLRFLDAAGKELAYADDTAGLAGDAQLSISAPADGSYTLELRDVQYTGGAGHYFHLRAGGFPLVQGTYPRRTAAGANVSLVGTTDDGLSATTGAAGVQLAGPVSLKSEHGSSLGTVVTTATAPVMEQEPNDGRDTATVVDAAATAIAGRFQAAGDVDWYQLTVTEKQHLSVTAHTRDVGSPADVVLQIHDSAGKQLQESDDVGVGDAQLAIALPAAGEYFVAVRELSGQGGAACTYDLAVEHGGRIEVTTSVDTAAIPKGGTLTIPVAVKRLGFTALFEIAAVDLPPGIVSTPVIVSPTQKTAHIALHATAETAAAYQHLFRIQAVTGADGVPIPVLYRPTPPAKKTTPNYNLPRMQTGVFAHAAGAAAYSLTADPAAIVITKGGEVKTTITAARTGDWKQEIEVATAVPAAELPGGITIAAAKITKNTADVVIKADDKVVPGRYTISLRGTLKKDKTTVIQPVPTITLEVKEAEAAKAAE